MTLTTNKPRTNGMRVAGAIGLVAGMLLLAGCHQRDMYRQPKYLPLEPSSFFGDQRSARPLVAGTVPRSGLRTNAVFFTGKENGKPVATFPLPVTKALLKRGEQRFNIFCSPCHGRVGMGNGMIVQRGYRQPPSYHIQRLEQEPVGYFFDVITHGFGVMPDYAEQIPPTDRWAIVAYVRTLQLSQHATLSDVPPAEREKLEAAKK